MNTRTRKCTCCHTEHHPGQWWSLRNYHGFSGLYCADCFDQIRHDAHDRPVNPQGLILARLRMG